MRDIGHGQKVIWTSPFRMSKGRWLNTALPLAAGTAALIATDRSVARALPNSHDQVVWCGRISQAGALYSLAGATAVPIIAGKLTGHPAAVRVGRSGAEALADALLVTYALKFAFGRERPDDKDGNLRFMHGKISFPSGHALTMWAAVTAVASDRHTPKWLKITGYIAAGTVSLSRIGARRHSPSDVLVGSVFGALIGRYVGQKNSQDPPAGDGP
jgi:membrane-associated phospholipid phosphatase